MNLKQRILQISYDKKLSHLSSCLNAVDVIDEIYNRKKLDEPFVLSCGHAGLAQYVILEKYEGKDAEVLFDKHGVHPSLDKENGIWASTGSLGQGLPIALGMAMADRTKDVYCVISDGECAEGSIWEALMIKSKFNVDNLKITALLNGFGAYDPIDRGELIKRLRAFDENITIEIVGGNLPEFLQGQKGHYVTMTEEQYKEAIEFYESK